LRHNLQNFLEKTRTLNSVSFTGEQNDSFNGFRANVFLGDNLDDDIVVVLEETTTLVDWVAMTPSMVALAVHTIIGDGDDFLLGS